jgi:hypothetical protein
VVAAQSIELERDGFLDAASTRAGLVVLTAFLLSFPGAVGTQVPSVTGSMVIVALLGPA